MTRGSHETRGLLKNRMYEEGGSMKKLAGGAGIGGKMKTTSCQKKQQAVVVNAYRHDTLHYYAHFCCILGENSPRLRVYKELYRNQLLSFIGEIK